MNRLPTAQRAQIIGVMVEGMSIRFVSRMTGASKNTIVKLLVDAGRACSAYQHSALRNLPYKRLQEGRRVSCYLPRLPRVNGRRRARLWQGSGS